jgi:hypothetical protein
MLDRLAQDGQDRARDAMLAGGAATPKSPDNRQRQPEADFLIAGEDKGRLPEDLSAQPEAQFLSNRKHSSSELTHLTLPKEFSQQASASATALGSAASTAALPSDHEIGHPRYRGSFCTAGVEINAARKRSLRKPLCFFPKLRETFADDPDIVRIVESLPLDMQQEASRRLATKGKEAAAAFLEGTEE